MCRSITSRRADHVFRPCITLCSFIFCIAYTSTSSAGWRGLYHVVHPVPLLGDLTWALEHCGTSPEGSSFVMVSKTFRARRAGAGWRDATRIAITIRSSGELRTQIVTHSLYSGPRSRLPHMNQGLVNGPSKGSRGVAFGAANIPNSRPSWPGRAQVCNEGDKIRTVTVCICGYRGDRDTQNIERKLARGAHFQPLSPESKQKDIRNHQ